jgi:Domain of unknown function (DUF1707)
VSDDRLRISDAEREQAAAELGEHFAQGRLTTDEHAERLDRIWAARTRGELAPVFADLPGPYGPIAPSRPAPTRSGHWSGGVGPGRRGGPWRRGVPGPLLVVLVILVALTIATHLPLILAGVVVWFLVVGRPRRRSWGHDWSRSVR